LAAKTILKRGFKANAERLAKEYRDKLNIHACSALCAFMLAEYLQITVYKATDFIKSHDYLELLSGTNGYDCGWSALTMITAAGNRIIIHNPFHSAARQQSNIMHELAHIICRHERSQKNYDFEIPFGMHEFDEIQEEEAKCLGSTLQLPTPGLLWSNKKNMSTEAIAAYFNTSSDMVLYRMNTTGIARRRLFL
jgi:Zn-dependent peptidase ImmA (M78 family)